MLIKRKWSLLLSLFVVALMGSPVHAQANPVASVESFFSTVEDMMMAVATSAAVIGFIGLAIMNLGSSLPLIADWKQENPKAARSVIMGLLLLIFVGGGGLVGLLSF
ncbi:MAG: TrbC/VirB2 family protein [Chloroflexota bacterium]